MGQPLNIGDEQPIENEVHYSQKIADRFKQTLSKYYKSGSFKRMFHPKMHGLVSAEFEVEKGLPPELKQGIFAEEKVFPAWIRFSNAKRHPSPDRRSDMRGCAIKLIGVEGEKLLEGEKNATTQDFLLVTAETLQTSSVKDFQKSIYALTGGFFSLFFYAITHIRVIIRSIRQISKCNNLLEEQYFSMTPSKFGDGQAVKYSVVPHKKANNSKPDTTDDDFLRNRLKKNLSTEDQYFDFMVQFQTEAEKMPIEDPTVKWDSEFHKVATIRIKKQSFDSFEQRNYGENLSFTPWHSIEAHRPLGGVNRARKLVYEQIAAFRRENNDVEVIEEPDSIRTFNQDPTNYEMKNNQKYIDQGGITIITEIDENKDIQELRDYLAKIGSDDVGGGIVNFEQMTSIHFARWFLMEDVQISDGKGGYSDQNKFPNSLVFTSNFDGKPNNHLREMLEVSREAIIKLYSFCKGFPENDPSDDDIIKFLNSNLNKNQLFWPAIRGGTVEQLKGESLLRTEIEDFLSRSQNDGTLEGKEPEEIRGAIEKFVADDPRLNWALTPRAKPSLGWNFKYYGNLVLKLIFLLPMALLLLIWLATVWIFNQRDNKYRKEIIRSRDFKALLKNEDRIFMNQLTVYGGIKKPYWYRTTQLKIGLWIFSLNGVYCSNKGQLSGIETIHFARWSIFNNGKNVMFLSNFDGAWEIYLSEFIDRSASAMNLTFGTTVGYPKVTGLFGEGAHDEQAFKTVVRNNQYPCQVWYSAYPRLTVKNILNNQKIRQVLSGTSNESTKDWLKRF